MQTKNIFTRLRRRIYFVTQTYCNQQNEADIMRIKLILPHFLKNICFQSSVKSAASKLMLLILTSSILIACGSGAESGSDAETSTTWYEDSDGDDFGDSSSSLIAITKPTGYVADDSDCNDDDIAIFPGAMELPNKVDDDCDTIVDNGINYFFTSSQPMKGLMGGLSGADGICQEFADNSNLPDGIYRAWLSSSTVAAKDRLTSSNNPYYLPNGVMLANDWSDFLAQVFLFPLSPGNGLDVDENGNKIIGSQNAWTNTTGDGMIVETDASKVCADWTSGSTGVLGINDQNAAGAWTNSTTGSCINAGTLAAGNRLYCVQQEATATLLVNTTLNVSDSDCSYDAGANLIEKGLDNGDGSGISNNGILEQDEVDLSYYACDAVGLGKYQLISFAFNIDGAKDVCENNFLSLAGWTTENELDQVIETCQLYGDSITPSLGFTPACYTQYKVNDALDAHDSVIDGSLMPSFSFGRWDFSPPTLPYPANNNVMVRADDSSLFHRASIAPVVCMSP